jgi:hypothetical protein
VRELIYADLCRWLDRGYLSVDLGQPDGFRPCQCDGCAQLYDTGDDWGEKIWRFHTELAERLLVSHPGKQVTIMSYIQTAMPPKTFTKFPANTKIMLTGTNEEDIAPWRDYDVPGGFTGYLYNWCPNLGTRYTPMRTPGHVETQAKRLAANHIQAFYRDGPGALYGLEGPVYYTMGRMFDDPERLSAKDLVPEFIDAAFGGPSAWHMRQFYDQLYHGITLYSDYLGTRSPAWTYQPAEGRRRKTVSDPFQLLGFLYPPPLLASLESHLAQAEQKAKTDKVKARLALVRREFDYVKDLARVVHLYHAYEIQPDLASRDRLLDAIDARNARIAAYYDARGRAVPASDGWALVMFPPPGHSASHLRLAYNNYQEPFESTCVNWDTAAVRAAPLPGARRLTVRLVEGPLTLESPAWTQSDAAELIALPAAAGAVPPTRKTTLRALADDQRLYVRVESSLPAEPQQADASGEAETIEVLLAPVPGSPVAYRFRVGPQPAARQDAAAGFVRDAMDPRYGQFDPDWSGDWSYDMRVAADQRVWTALIAVPFQTLGVDAPKPGTFWRGNIGRASRVGAEPQQPERTAWSTAAGMRRLDDQKRLRRTRFRVKGSGAYTGNPGLFPSEFSRIRLQGYDQATKRVASGEMVLDALNRGAGRMLQFPGANCRVPDTKESCILGNVRSASVTVADWRLLGIVFEYQKGGVAMGRVYLGVNMEFVRHDDKSFEWGVEKAAELGYEYVEPMVHWGRELLSEAGYFHSVSMLDDPLRIRRRASGRVSSCPACPRIARCASRRSAPST